MNGSVESEVAALESIYTSLVWSSVTTEEGRHEDRINKTLMKILQRITTQECEAT